MPRWQLVASLALFVLVIPVVLAIQFRVARAVFFDGETYCEFRARESEKYGLDYYETLCVCELFKW